MHQPAVYIRATGHNPICGHFFSGHPEISGAMQCKHANLLEAAWVHQFCHSFARGQFARRVMFLNA